ncbi:hypothetical protein HanIR_Chr10g0474431 [Helianthus annuus]|nr:hypothetical protein HanIR_Chr10g0474431 [Helianthus annuus]
MHEDMHFLVMGKFDVVCQCFKYSLYSIVHNRIGSWLLLQTFGESYRLRVHPKVLPLLGYHSSEVIVTPSISQWQDENDPEL